MSVRKALGAALLGMWGMLSGCMSFKTDDFSRAASRYFEQQELNYLRNSESTLRDMRYWNADPSGFSSKQFTTDQEEQDYKDAALKETGKHVKKALSRTVQQVVKGEVGKSIADIVGPSLLDEVGPLPHDAQPVDAIPYRQAVEQFKFKGKAFTPKAKVNRDEFEAGFDFFKVAGVRYGRAWDNTEEWLKVKLRIQLMRDLYAAGYWERTMPDEGKDRDRIGAGVNWKSLGFDYSFDDAGKKDDHRFTLSVDLWRN